MKADNIEIILKQRYKCGLFPATTKKSKTGYEKIWIRDNLYIALGFWEGGYTKIARLIIFKLIRILYEHEYKIDWAIKNKPKHNYEYIHARYKPGTWKEYHEEWGNKQNDAIGMLLFMYGKVEKDGIKSYPQHNKIIQKLVNYLESIEYWKCPDNGMWEEYEEVHASSVGACVAGLKNIKHIVKVKKSLITKGEKALKELLPKESKTKETDLALLSLIYPYNLVDDKMKKKILKKIETRLLRKKGTIRYIGDNYYGNGEAEWTMGLPWLAKIYKDMGKTAKYNAYLKKSMHVMDNDLLFPELYYKTPKIPNKNTPLLWSHAMFIIALS